MPRTMRWSFSNFTLALEVTEHEDGTVTLRIVPRG